VEKVAKQTLSAFRAPSGLDRTSSTSDEPLQTSAETLQGGGQQIDGGFDRVVVVAHEQPVDMDLSAAGRSGERPRSGSASRGSW